MTPFRTLATVRHHGMHLTDYEFAVPLDHGHPTGEALSIFARALRHGDHASEKRQWLVFLQGGPGYPGPRPLTNSGWVKRALEDYHVLLLDSRGNGGSSVVLPQTLARRGDALRAGAVPEAFSRRQHRARCRIDPAAAGRRRRAVERPRPELRRLLRRALPVLLSAGTARGVHHRRTAAAVRQRRRLLPAHLSRGPAQDATNSSRAIPATTRCAAASWNTCIGTTSRCPPVAASPSAASSRWASCSASTRAWRISTTSSRSAFCAGVAGDELSLPFLRALENSQTFETNPIFAVLHEMCYTQGAASRWSAERVRGEFPETNWAPGQTAVVHRRDDLSVDVRRLSGPAPAARRRGAARQRRRVAGAVRPGAARAEHGAVGRRDLRRGHVRAARAVRADRRRHQRA